MTLMSGPAPPRKRKRPLVRSVVTTSRGPTSSSNRVSHAPNRSVTYRQQKGRLGHSTTSTYIKESIRAEASRSATKPSPVLCDESACDHSDQSEPKSMLVQEHEVSMIHLFSGVSVLNILSRLSRPRCMNGCRFAARTLTKSFGTKVAVGKSCVRIVRNNPESSNAEIVVEDVYRVHHVWLRDTYSCLCITYS